MARDTTSEMEVWVDAEEGEYITYLPNEPKPDSRMPEMEYVGSGRTWHEIDEVIKADRKKRGWLDDGPFIEGEGRV